MSIDFINTFLQTATPSELHQIKDLILTLQTQRQLRNLATGTSSFDQYGNVCAKGNIVKISTIEEYEC